MKSLSTGKATSSSPFTILQPDNWKSHGLYDRASEASTDLIEMAIRDLDDYLTLFPDRLQVREVRDALRASKAERLSALV